MNKQVLIDKAVEQLKGVVIIGDENVFMTPNGDFVSTPLGHRPVRKSEFVCGVVAFKQRARELGWINGYKYGVEYETNGKKPDLPDDLEVEVEGRNPGQWLQPRKVRSNQWRLTNKFRIVDDRYKPKTELVEQKMIEITDTTKGLHGEITVTSEKDIWHLHDELPPFGTKCEYITFERSRGFKECYFVGLNSTGNIVIETEVGELKCYHKQQIKFRPIKSEREKFIELASKIMHQTEGGVINDISLGQMFDAGFRAPE